MPAPAADFILGMMNPYKGFDPNESAKAAVAAGQLGESRAARRQRGEQFNLENARANSYLDLANRQFDTGQANDLRDKQISAFTKFQAAVDSGDTEQADLALGELRILGVGVEKYGGQSGGSAMGQPPGPPPSSAIPDPMAPNPAAGPPSMPTPMSPKDAQTGKELDALGKSANAMTYDQAPDPMAAMGAPSVRPGPSRAAGEGMPKQAPDTPSASADPTGPRPAPARASTLPGDEPKEAGTPGAERNPIVHGYRLKFGDKTIDINPDSIAERQRVRVAGVFDPLIEAAATPEEKRAAIQAKYAAMESVGTVKPEQAVAMGLDLYTGNLDRQAREKRAKIVGGKGGVGDGYAGVSGLSKDENARLSTLNDDIRTYVQGAESKFNIPELRKALDNGNKVGSLLASGNSVGQRAALAATLKGWFSSVTSNTELKFLLESTGKWGSIEQGYNNWVNGGELTNDFITKLKEAIVIGNDFARRKLNDVGNQVSEGAASDFTFSGRMTPEEAEKMRRNIKERFTGQEKRSGTKRARGSMEGEAPGKPSKSASAKNAAAKRLLGR